MHFPNASSASTEIITQFLLFSLLMWCITLIHLLMLNQPCLSEMPNHLVMMKDISDMLLDSINLYLLRLGFLFVFLLLFFFFVCLFSFMFTSGILVYSSPGHLFLVLEVGCASLTEFWEDPLPYNYFE